MNGISFLNSRKGKTLKKYKFVLPDKWDSNFVSLVSHLMFDGNMRTTWFAYNSRNVVLINYIADQANNCLNVKEYKIYRDKISGVTRIAFHNVEVASFLKNRTNELLKYIIKATSQEKISFLKSFFDDEGSIRFRNRQRSIHGYQKSVNILRLVKKILLDFDIQSKVDIKYGEIVISGKENLLKFQKNINFTPGLRINGRRSNSVWKKDLEKRKILQMAINSYKK